MSNVTSYTTDTYRLRCGAPMPLGGGGFVLHTFMAEKSRVEVAICVSTIPSSSDFRGQGGKLVAANYTKLKGKSSGLFQGSKTYQPIFVSEGNYF